MKRITHGKIYLDRKEISSINLDVYRSKIGLVLNSNYLFEGSIWQNLTLNSPSISEKEVYDLLENFGVLNEIKHLPETINTYVFPGTKMLSHVLTQKICLIRVLLKSPELLLIEEEFIFSDEDIEALMNFAKRHHMSVLLASKEKMSSRLKDVKLN